MSAIFAAFNPMAQQSENFTVNYPIGKVYCAVIQAARGDFRLKSRNDKLFRVQIQTRASLFSWGEFLTVQLSENGGRTTVSVSSQPKTWVGSGSAMSQVTIGRRNKRNIDDLLEAVSRNL